MRTDEGIATGLSYTVKKADILIIEVMGAININQASEYADDGAIVII
ncbi:MAG: hypothetical protein R2880_01715 [Deinococcales bacterium]